MIEPSDAGVKAQRATPALTATDEQPLIELPLLRKLTVPVAPLGEIVAVKVSTMPKVVVEAAAERDVVVGVEKP